MERVIGMDGIDRILGEAEILPQEVICIQGEVQGEVPFGARLGKPNCISSAAEGFN